MHRSPAIALGLALVGGSALAVWLVGRTPVAVAAQAPEPAPAVAATRDAIRLNGLVEAVDFYSVVVPRVTGSTGTGPAQLTIVRLAPKGTLVKKGDLLVEFDRQQQLRNALDKRAEWMDLEEQIKKKRADQNSLRAQDETELKTAENAVALAKLEVLKNPLLPRIEAEKNTLSLEAAEAKFVQLR